MLVVILVAIGSFVNGDLGLNFAIQGVPYSVNRAIGMGVQPVVSANLTISLNETMDSSGVLGILRSIGNEVVTPLDLLMAGIISAASDKSGDPSTVFASLQLWHWKNLRQLQQIYKQNVSMVITSSLITDYTSPLRNISSILSMLGTLMSTIAKEKQATIMQRLNLNETVDTSLKNLIQVVTNLNRTNYGVYSSVIRASDNSLKSINQTYAAVLSKASNFNNGNMTNLINFLANTSTVASGALDEIQNNTASFTLNLAYALGNQTTNISQSIYNGIRNVSDTASTSDSIYARICERKYAAMFQQSGLSPSRLNFCLQSEGASLSSFAQLVIPAMFADIFRWVGPQVLRINMCSVANGTCSVGAFNAFSDFSSRMSTKYDLMRRAVLAEQDLALYRATSCIDAVSNDIQDLAIIIQDKFVNCMTTGN
ncbi:AAEL017359-PA [Aedes aegypti]|uniref:AAEL017359-PA n=1 Tax=Aedes aegypti TaxID=7159 RepID=J9HSA6_AEDAE|nr:AAEL017359-PA [Aedes aegypti]